MVALREGVASCAEAKALVVEALSSEDTVLQALGVLLADKLEVEGVEERLRELSRRVERVELKDPAGGEARVVDLGEAAQSLLSKTRARKVEATLLELAKTESDKSVRAVLYARDVGASRLAEKLEKVGGVKVVRVLESTNAVSVEAPASKVVELADLSEVASIRLARVFKTLGEGTW